MITLLVLIQTKPLAWDLLGGVELIVVVLESGLVLVLHHELLMLPVVITTVSSRVCL